MFSGNYRLIILVFVTGFVLFSIVSCSEQERVDPHSQQNANTRHISALEQIQKEILPEAREILNGEFLPGDNTLLAVLSEVNTANDWGVRIDIILKKNNSIFEKYYSTETLEGAFNHGTFRSVRFPETSYDMLIYDSEDYFIGTSGGEIFFYVVDPLNKKTIYSHLTVSPGEVPELFIQNELSSKVIRDFIIKRFLDDYPDLVISSKDNDIE